MSDSLAIAPPPGRAAHAQSIAPALEALTTGRGGVVLLSGEGGVGKTTLSAWACEEARNRDVLVLEAPCFALSSGTPYACLVSAFGPVMRSRRRLDPEELVRGLPSLGLIFDGIPAAELPIADSELARSRLHGAIATLVSRLTARTPVLLEVDDLHWADVASLEALLLLTSDLPDLPLLVLATMRPYEMAERPETKQLLRTLRSADWTTIVDVGGLDLDATRSLVRQRLGSIIPRGLVEEVHRRSGGTPLVAEEIVELLIETGALVPTGRRWEFRANDDALVPSVADDLIGDRLTRLGPASIELVAAVAMAAEPVGTSVLAQVTGAVVEVLAADLEVLRRSGLLDVTERGSEAEWVVHHPIIGDVALSLVPPPRRSALHRSYATALSAAGAEHRGRHLLGAGDEARTADDLAVLAEAGRLAVERGAPADASRLLGVVVDTIDQQGIAVHLLRDAVRLLGLAWWRRGEFDVATHHLERARLLARAAGDLAAEATLVIETYEASWTGAHDLLGADARCDDLLARLAEAGDLVTAHRLARSRLTNRMRGGAVDRLEESLAELAQISRHIDDREAKLWDAHFGLLPDMYALRNGVEILAALDAEMEPSREFPDLHRRVLHERLDALLAIGSREQIVEAIRAEREFGERMGDWPTWRIGMASWHVAAGDGDFERTIEIEQIVSVGRFDRPSGYVIAAGALGDLVSGLARGPSGGATVDRPVSDPVLEQLLVIAHFWSAVEDRVAAAGAVVDWWRDRPFIAGVPLLSAITAGVAMLVLDDTSGCRSIIDLLAAYDGGIGRSSAWASVLRAEISDKPSERAEAYLDAAQRFESLGRPFDAAVCVLTAAENGAAVAPDQLARAATRFEAAPAPWMRDRLAAVWSADRPATVADPLDDLGLTAREREVAEVVVEGLSNREVANRLFISVRTVTSHLDHIYTKLGIGSRSELAERFPDRPNTDT